MAEQGESMDDVFKLLKTPTGQREASTENSETNATGNGDLLSGVQQWEDATRAAEGGKKAEEEANQGGSEFKKESSPKGASAVGEQESTEKRDAKVSAEGQGELEKAISGISERMERLEQVATSLAKEVKGLKDANADLANQVSSQSKLIKAYQEKQNNPSPTPHASQSSPQSKASSSGAAPPPPPPPPPPAPPQEAGPARSQQSSFAAHDSSISNADPSPKSDAGGGRTAAAVVQECQQMGFNPSSAWRVVSELANSGHEVDVHTVVDMLLQRGG